MTAALSNTQIDKLGSRLRKGSLSESDLRDLDAYRRSFGPAYETVVRTLRERLRLKPTGRPAKSTGALVEKLRRESIRLAQVQDIAGCRVVVPNIARQEQVVTAFRREFPSAHVMDRREKPSFGYRAVHVIVDVSGKLVEIQVRTALQHVWAELCEKLSDIRDPSIKYGGGDQQTKEMLADASRIVKSMEGDELAVIQLKTRLVGLPVRNQQRRQEVLKEIRALEREIASDRKGLGRTLTNLISELDTDAGQLR